MEKIDMERKDVIEKIKKLMAIANDPGASDQEIQTSTYRARKLMIEYKLSEKDLFNKKFTDDDVKEICLDGISSGYFIWVLKALAENFRCKAGYRGKINTNKCTFVIVGLNEDLEILKPIAEGVLYYIDSMLKDIKESYIGDEDFRVYKREYMNGFADGLRNALKKAFLEMDIDKKYELMIVGIPAVVEEYVHKNFNHKKCIITKHSEDGYDLGYKHEKNYDIENKELLVSQ